MSWSKWFDHANPGAHLPPLVAPGVLVDLECSGRVGTPWFGVEMKERFRVETGDCFRADLSACTTAPLGFKGGAILVLRYRVWLEEPLEDVIENEKEVEDA